VRRAQFFVAVLGAGCFGEPVRFHGGPPDVDAGFPSSADAREASTPDADVAWTTDALESADATSVIGTDSGAAESISGDIVFTAASDHQIYTVNIDGTARTRLTATGTNGWPVWSPDGRKIAFIRYTTNMFTGDVYIMDADGSNCVQRTSGGLYGSVAWSPDGQKLAVSTEGLYFSDIWVIGVASDGAAPMLVAPDARTPAWSPDSKKIVFVRVSGDDGYESMGTVNADGSGLSLITDVLSSYHGLDWSKQDLLVWSRGGTVYTSKPDGSEVTPVVGYNTTTLSSWSPGGDWLVLGLWTCASTSCLPGNYQSELAYVSSNGGPVHPIVTDGFRPHWRP
jgi:TolB protein